MKQHTIHQLPPGAFTGRPGPIAPPPQRTPKQHQVHQLPTGAFAAIVGTRKQPPPEPAEGFQRHLVWEETPAQRRFRVPLTSVPEPSPMPRTSVRGRKSRNEDT